MTGWFSVVFEPMTKMQSAFLDLCNGVRHGAASKGHRQTGDGGAVSETGAVVDVVRSQGGAGHLLEEVVLLVRALGRGQDADCIRSMFLLHLLQAFCHRFQSFIPRGLPKCPVLLDERLRKPVGAVDIIEPESAFDAGPAPVHAEVPVRGNLEHLVVFHIEDQGASHPAIGADRRDLLHLPVPPLEAARLFTQGPYRADADTVSAEDARGLLHGPIEGGRDLCVKPALGLIDCLAVLQLMTDGHAPSAEDTLVVVPFEEGIGCPDGVVVFISHKSWFPDAKLIGVFFELAGAALLAGHAVIGMIGEQKLDDQFPGIQHPLRIGTNDHLVGHG